MSFEANEAINGLYGYVYDEDGKQLQGTQEFDTNIDIDKEAIVIAGKFLKGHKVMGGEGKGSMKVVKLDSRLSQKVADNPQDKYNYIGKLADPTARGEEAILFIGVSFDSTKLLSYKVGEIVEDDFDFTFDDYRYLKSID